MHNTGNEIESNDILDFEDNTVNLDILMNADQEYWTDRLGNKRPTIDYALRMAGFTPAGFDFTTGGVLKNGDRNKCVFNQADQTWYSWSGNLPYNVIAGSVPGEGWKVVSFKHARIVLSGVGCKEGSDNTETLNKLFQRFENTGVEIYVDKTFPISGEVKINKLLLTGPGKIIGEGKLVGVITNATIPYELVQVWNNIVVQYDRVDDVHDFDVILDPLFGDNSSDYKVETLQRALDVVAAKVKLDSSKSYTIALRSGRTEVDKKLVIDPVLHGWGGKITDSFDIMNFSFDEFELNLDIDNKCGIKLVSYPGETPVITPKTTWFFKSNTIGYYKNRSVVSNGFQKRFFKLFGCDGKERFCAASWDRETDTVNRNQNKNILITNVNGEIKHGIKVDAQLLKLLRKASVDELSSIRVRVTHWFTSSWHLENINLNGDDLTFKGYAADRAYGDGWSYINADQFGAPFFIENLKHFIKKEDEFSTTDTEVILPNDALAFFTTSHIDGNGLLDLGAVNNIIIDGSIKVKYVTTDPIKVASGTWGVKNNPGAALILGNYGKINGIDFYGIESDAIKMGKVGCVIKDADFSYIGGNGIVHIDGAHSSIVKRCKVKYPGLDQVGAFGIHLTGTNIEISDNTVLEGGFSSFRFDSSNFITDKSDGELKTEPKKITDEVLDAWGDVSLITFQWLEAVKEKGSSARKHVGVIAQQIRDAFLQKALDARDYGFLCYDEWDEVTEPVYETLSKTVTVINEQGEEVQTEITEQVETGEIKVIREAGSVWGIRSDQCLFMEAAFQRRRADRIEERLSALENK